MKKREYTIFFTIVLLFSLSSCSNKNEDTDTYKSRDLPIETVFDDLGSEEEVSDEKKEEDQNKDKKVEEKEKNEDKEKADNKSEAKKEGDKEEEKPSKSELYTIKTPLNMRSTPEIAEGNIVDTLQPGTEITIIERNLGADKNWASIDYKGKVFFVNTESF